MPETNLPPRPDGPLRIVVVDDHKMVREAVAAAIDLADDLVFIGMAANGTEGLSLISSRSPDIAVIDLGMPGLNGVALLKAARKISPATRFVLLTGAPLTEKERSRLMALSDAFLHKEEGVEVLLAAIRKASAVPARPVATNTESADSSLLQIDTLTEREHEVLSEIGRGHSVKKIAFRLKCAPGTVRKHRQNILEKLSLNSTAQLVRLALQLGRGG